MKFNVGDLIHVKPPINDEERKYYVKGIGYIKTKFRKPVNKYVTWIIIQWMDEPIETLEYSVTELEALIPDWLIYPVKKK